MKRRFSLTLFSALAVAAVPGCADDPVEAGPSGTGCTVTDRGDGTSAIHCADGTELVVKNGKDGVDGKDGPEGTAGEKGEDGADAEPCTLAENADGTHTLTCGDQSVVIGGTCEGGFPGDVFLADPEHADLSLTLFQVSGCTWVRGSVNVDGYSGTELPEAFKRITEVDGYIIIGDESGTGLEVLSFPALKRIGYDLQLGENDALAEIADFPALQEAGSLTFSYCPELRTIGSFPALESVSSITSWGNPKLETIGNFPALKQIGFRLSIMDNSRLKTIGSFDDLTEVNLFQFQQLPSLTDMGSFPKLARVRRLEVQQNHDLPALADFPMLKEIYGSGSSDGIYIWSNNKLASIAGLSSLTTVVKHVEVYGNPALPHKAVVDLFENVDIDGDTMFCGNKDGPSC